MKIQYKEESEYGQEVLELIGMCVSLQDPEKEYTLGEIREKLRQIRGRCSMMDLHLEIYHGRSREDYLGVD